MENSNILVVDDDDENLTVARVILESCGFSVYGARDFKDIVTLLDQKNPVLDLIVLDLILPIFDGFIIAEFFRSHPLYKKTPIIAITARRYTDDKEKAIKSGCDCFIRKPYSVDNFINTINILLKQNQLKKDIYSIRTS